MNLTRAIVPTAIAALAIASCHAPHPLEAADSCACSPREYCRVRPPPADRSAERATVECVPLPGACGSEPTCACLGRPIDGCREELGAFTILEPRPVAACAECGAEEYCWREGSRAPLCRVLPARCESKPTCDCLLASRSMATAACEERAGRLQASIAR